MIRLLGTLVGSALAIALLLLLVGIPQFRAPDVDLDAAIVTLPLKTAPVEQPDAHSVAVDAVDERPLEPPADEPVTLTDTAMPADDADVALEPALQNIPEPDSADARQVAQVQSTALTTDPGWHAFWSPFRSEIAAQGFVTRLQSVTGLDYRIDKVEIGVYQVAFAYADESEIPAKLARISAATGLELASR